MVSRNRFGQSVVAVRLLRPEGWRLSAGGLRYRLRRTRHMFAELGHRMVGIGGYPRHANGAIDTLIGACEVPQFIETIPFHSALEFHFDGILDPRRCLREPSFVGAPLSAWKAVFASNEIEKKKTKILE